MILSDITYTFINRYLSSEGEEALAGGVHEDDLVVGITAVGVDPEDELAFGVVGGEAVAGEEVGRLHDSEVSLLLVAAGGFHGDTAAVHRLQFY